MHRATSRRRRLLLLGGAERDAGTAATGTAELNGGSPARTGEDCSASSPALTSRPGEKFLAACRANARVPRLRISPGGDAPPFEFEFRRPFALVGRAERCDLRFDHADVSYRHAYLQLVNGRLHCFDLASRTGTRWPDGARASGWLNGSGAIHIGPVLIEPIELLTAEDSSAQQDADTLPATGIDGGMAGGELPQACLEWTTTSGESQSACLSRPVNLLGWSQSCHVRLNREQVSRVHASLVLTPAGVWVVDLLGRGGTLVEGKPVSYARLRDGADMQIGTLPFRLRLGKSAIEAARQSDARERQHPPEMAIQQNIHKMLAALRADEHNLSVEALRRVDEIQRELQAIELLEQERNSRWQKIMTLLNGGAVELPLPPTESASGEPRSAGRAN